MSNPKKQISLNLFSYHEEIEDMSSLGIVHTLNLTRCQGITDVSTLENVHTLGLSKCGGIEDVTE